MFWNYKSINIQRAENKKRLADALCLYDCFCPFGRSVIVLFKWDLLHFIIHSSISPKIILFNSKSFFQSAGQVPCNLLGWLSHSTVFLSYCNQNTDIMAAKTSEWQIFIQLSSNPIHNKMNSFTTVLLLALLSSSLAQVNILQSTTSTVITSPPGQSTVFNTGLGNILGVGINWIHSSTYTPGTKIFEEKFYASCTGAATLSITAYASFSAYLDGVLIGSGSNSKQVFTFQIKLSCGSHILRVVVFSQDKTPALTFVIKQDQSNCFKCQATGFWNEQVCKCQCINPKPTLPACLCKSPKVWKDYPFCGCGCPTIYTLANLDIASAATTAVRDATAAVGAVAGGDQGNNEDDAAGASASATDKIAAFAPLCLAPKYYSQNTCKCVCHYKYCGPKEYFDENTCSCWPYIY